MDVAAYPRTTTHLVRRLSGYRAVGGLLGTFCVLAAHAATDDADSARDARTLDELTRPASKVEVGAVGIGRGSPAAGGRYGLPDRGDAGILNFDLRGNQTSYGNSSDDKTRWRLTGTDLGLGSRGVSGEYGRQGVYRLTFGYDEMRWLQSGSYQTPFLGAGSANLVLPSVFVRGADTAAMGTLAGAMQRFDLESARRRSEVGLSYWLAPEWELRFGIRNEARYGSKIRGAEFGSNGGNPRAALLPEPIDSSTQLLDGSLAFSDEDLHLTFSYHGSIFRNRVDALTWQNPYTSAPWVGGASGLPANFSLATGRMAVAPDNEFHQFTLSGAYDISATTRLTVTASRGRMTQDEVFLPYTVNPGLVSTALPRTSLGGLVETTFLHAKLSMRPVRGLAVTASLRHENRDNKTPMSEYIYVGGDIQLQPQPGANSDRIRTNLPRSRLHQQASLDADYRLSTALSLKAGWDHDVVERSYAEVERSVENTYRIALRRGGSGPWTANASYAWIERRGTQYLYNLPYLASYTSPAYVNGLLATNGCAVPVDCVRAGPLQNKFYLADRNRERVRLSAGFTPDAPLSAQARWDLNRDRYPHSPYGVTAATGWSAGLDLAYLASEDFSATLFTSFENQRTRERSHQIAAAGGSGSADADWVNRFSDRTASIGMGVKYKGLLGHRLELGVDVVAVRGRSPIATTVGPAVTAAQNPATALPDLVARSDSIDLSARYAVDRQTGIVLNYFYRRLSSADWAYRQVQVATLANLIGTNEVPTRYTVHGIGVSYIYRFR